MRKAIPALFVTTLCLFMTGCGQAPVKTTVPPSGSAPVALTLGETGGTSPAGVALLVSSLRFASASLQPGNVPLLSSTNPISINVGQLWGDSAFLGSANVPAGTYDSLALTFASPQFTIFNETGSAVGTCANNAICQLTPPTTPVTLTISSTPFLLDVTANAPLALLVNVNLQKVIQPDLSVNLAAPNAVTVSPMPPNPQNGQLTAGLGRVYGTVTSLGTNQFTLKTPWNQTLAIQVNGRTYYSIPSNAFCDGPCNSTCNGMGQGFPCLLSGDVLRADVAVQSDGSVFAYELDYLVGPGQEVYEGPITSLSTSGGTTTMNLILQNPAAIMGLSPAVYGIVTVPPTGVTYSVDSGSFTLPSVASMGTFTEAGNLRVGQLVTISPEGSVTPGSAAFGLPSLAFTAGSIALEPSYFVATITSLEASNSNFLISPQAQFFTEFLPVPVSLLNPINVSVYATSQTSYIDFSPNNFSGLSLNIPVEVAGWLLPYVGANPACVPCAQTYGVAVAKSVQNAPNY